MKKLLYCVVLVLFGCFGSSTSNDDPAPSDTTRTTDTTTTATTDVTLSVSDVGGSAWSSTGFPLIFTFPDNVNNANCDSVVVQIYINGILSDLSCVLAKGTTKTISFTKNGLMLVKYRGKSSKLGYIGDEKSLTLTIPNSLPSIFHNTIPSNLKTGIEYSINFEGSNDIDGTITKYYIDWGDGASNSTTNTNASTFTHTYTRTGDFNIILRAYDDGATGSNYSEKKIPVTVSSSQILDPQFDISTTIDGKVYKNDEISAQKVYAGDLIYLDVSNCTASEEATIQSYKWDIYWENKWTTIATRSSGNGFNYNLNWIGSASVRLTITDSKGNETSVERNLTVTNRIPTAKLDADKVSGYSPLKVYFNWSSVDIDKNITKLGTDSEPLDKVSYYYTPSGVNWSQKIDNYQDATFNDVGTHYFYLRVEDQYGGVAYDTIDIKVNGADYSFDILNFDKTDNTNSSQSLTGDQLRFQFTTSTPDMIESVSFRHSPQVSLGNVYNLMYII